MSRFITIEDLYQFKFLSRPRISPDGQRVAFVVTTIDERKHEYRSSIWVVPSAGGEAKRFTGGIANAHTPSWSPDGRWLAFVSERQGEDTSTNPSVGASAERSGASINLSRPSPIDRPSDKKQRGKGKGQIWLMPTDGGEAHQLTFMPHGATHPTWSPDSKQLIFCAAVGPLDEETEDGKPLPKARVIDRLYYRLDGVGFIYERRQHLFLIDIAGSDLQPQEPVQLTDGDWDDADPAWSPDGTRIAFSSSRGEDRWRTPCPDIYTLSLKNGQGRSNLGGDLADQSALGTINRPLQSTDTSQVGELVRLTDGTLSSRSPSWSADGKTLAYLAKPKLHSGNHMELFTIGADARESSPRCLTSEFEGSCSDWTNSDVTDEHILPPPAWSSDGETLYVLAAQRGASRVFAISKEGAGKQPPTLTPGNIHVLDFSVDASKRNIATLIENPTHVAEIFMCSTTSPGEVRQITSFNDALFKNLTLATPEYMPYTGVDGWPIDGWILKPQGFDPKKKYPLIVEIHGGPATQYGYGFMHEMQMLVAEGYVVLYTNPRGSLGYGRDFSLAVKGAWGEKDSLDIMAGVDALLQKGRDKSGPYIDEQRMGVIGGSYGGFMTSWLVGHTDRFKAAVSDRAVINRYSFFGSSDIGWDFTDDDLEVAPWDDPEPYVRTSPITYVKNIHTPLLIIHSENDLRCSIEQSEQMFAALKYMGREVLFVRFEGQSHGLSRGGHPKLRLERLRHIRAWFEKHLG